MRAPLIRFVTALALAAALLQTAGAQQHTPPQDPPATNPPPQDPQQPRPIFKTGINFVRVDVIVSDKNGNPILDLKPEEFSISEDGRAQKIEQFDVIKIDPLDQVEGPTNSQIHSRQDEEREAARPEVRLFTILLDDYHVRRGNDMAVRRPLIDFIQNQLAPADMVAIMYPMTPVNDITFTRSRTAMVSAIEKFEGRKFKYEPRNMYEEQYAFYPAETVERIRNQITMDALKAAAIRMGGLREGRKSIIFVSEGLTESLPPQLADPVAALPGVGNPNRSNPGAQRDERTEWMRKTDLLSDLRDVFQTVNTQNTSIYSVDPRGLAAFEYGINEGIGLESDNIGLKSSLDTLHTLSNNTDGRAIVNRNDLAVGMKQIMRDSSGYYLLGYSSSRAPTDGKFHEIDVKVSRRGVQVRARRGYWALTEEDVARATAPPKPDAPVAVTRALSLLAEPPGGRAARVWVGTARGESGRSRVTVVWEPGRVEAGTRSLTPAARILLTAVAPNGQPVFRGRVPEQAPAAATAPGGSAAFEVAPGQLQLKITVEGQDGEVLDASVREVAVPDYTQVQAALGTPRIYRGRTARDIQAIRADANAAPAVERLFSRTERLLVRVDSYGPGGTAPAVTGKLLNRAGSTMSNLAFQRAADGPFEIELPLSSLAAGEYLIELTAKSESGTAQETIAFRVGR
jgi:VWFA-related protein